MNKKNIKMIFMGTSEFSVPIFNRLCDEYDMQLAVCTPDKPAGRGKQLSASPLKIVAQERNIPVEQPEKLKDPSFIHKLKTLKPDIIIVVAYGKILPGEIINLPEHGCLNVHASLLPKYRGASPIQTAILNGDKTTGITIILMDLGMDTGDIIRQERLSISENDDFYSLSEKLSKLGADIINEIIPDYINGHLNLRIQDDDEASYCYKINEKMSAIKWIKSARSINNQIKAFARQTGTYTNYNDQRMKIIEAKVCQNQASEKLKIGQVYQCDCQPQNICVKCGKNALALQVVQLQGKNPMPIKDFINGHQDFIHTILK